MNPSLLQPNNFLGTLLLGILNWKLFINLKIFGGKCEWKYHRGNLCAKRGLILGWIPSE
jgi:hypothetical protein